MDKLTEPTALPDFNSAFLCLMVCSGAEQFSDSIRIIAVCII